MFFEPRPSRGRRSQLRISERRFLLMLGDVLAIIIAILISLIIWSLVAKSRTFGFAFVWEQVYWFFLLPGLWLLLASANDFYDLQLAARRTATMGRLITITLQLLVVYLLIFFFSPRDALPRLFILYYAAFSFVFIGLWRLWRPYLIGWAISQRRALVVGTGWESETIIQAVQARAPDQYNLIGVIGSSADIEQTVESVPIIGTGSDILNLARQHGVSELIVATPCELSGELFQGVMDCYQQGLSIVPMPILYERLTERVPVEHVGKDWAIVLPIETASILNPYVPLKRLMDITLSVIGLMIFAVMLPVLAAILWLDSPGPIFFRQVRVGQGGRLFKIVKLRSMIPDAEKATGAVFAGHNDPRITHVGWFLRRSRLDEVPQLWNVLRGEMSMIGPRPERPEFIDELTREIPFYRARLAAKPGLTGWAQVRYHYGNTTQDHLVKLQYDLYYIRHQSVLLDLQILIRTAWKMLSFAGT